MEDVMPEMYFPVDHFALSGEFEPAEFIDRGTARTAR